MPFSPIYVRSLKQRSLIRINRFSIEQSNWEIVNKRFQNKIYVIELLILLINSHSTASTLTVRANRFALHQFDSNKLNLI